MLADTIQSYETAKNTRQQAWERIDDERSQILSLLEREMETEQTALGQTQQAEYDAAELQQQNLLPRTELAAQMAHQARSQLEESGLTYITAINTTPAEIDLSSSQSDQKTLAATTFTTIQTEYANLRNQMCTLGRTYVENGQWDAARKVVQPLFQDAEGDYATQAKQVYCESYYQQAQNALDQNQWVAARQHFQNIIDVDIAYKDAATLIQDTHGLQRLRRWWRNRFGTSLPRLKITWS